MLKLLKYELIRSKNILCIALVVLLLIEALFLVGFFAGNESVLATAVSFLVLYGVGGLCAIIIYAVNRFYTDLKNRHGYMLFLTPRNAYQIVGSKVLHSFLVMLAGVGLFAGAVALDVSIAVTATENSDMFMLLWESIFNTAEMDWTVWLSPVVYMIDWFNMILTIYFAIALTFTFFNHKKFKGWLSFAVYLGVDFVISFITNLVMSPVESNFMNSMETLDTYSYAEYMANGGMTYLIAAVLLELVIATLLYFATSLLMEKKLDLQ